MDNALFDHISDDVCDQSMFDGPSRVNSNSIFVSIIISLLELTLA